MPWTHEESPARRHRARRRRLRRDRGGRAARRAAARCPTGRSCSSASSTSPIRAGRTATCIPLYAYAHVPAGYTGDVTARIEAQIERFAPGFRERILARHVRSVAQMEAHNANYVGGDVVTGANDPRQLVFRPRAALDPYTIGHPRRLPVLGGDAARRRRPRHVRLQRGALRAAAAQARRSLGRGREHGRGRVGHATHALDCGGRCRAGPLTAQRWQQNGNQATGRPGSVSA